MAAISKANRFSAPRSNSCVRIQTARFAALAAAASRTTDSSPNDKNAEYAVRYVSHAETNAVSIAANDSAAIIISAHSGARPRNSDVPKSPIPSESAIPQMNKTIAIPSLLSCTSKLYHKDNAKYIGTVYNRKDKGKEEEDRDGQYG